AEAVSGTCQGLARVILAGLLGGRPGGRRRDARQENGLEAVTDSLPSAQVGRVVAIPAAPRSRCGPKSPRSPNSSSSRALQKRFLGQRRARVLVLVMGQGGANPIYKQYFNILRWRSGSGGGI